MRVEIGLIASIWATLRPLLATLKISSGE